MDEIFKKIIPLFSNSRPMTARELIGMLECVRGEAAECLRELATGPRGLSAKALGQRLFFLRGRRIGGQVLQARVGHGGTLRYWVSKTEACGGLLVSGVEQQSFVDLINSLALETVWVV